MKLGRKRLLFSASTGIALMSAGILLHVSGANAADHNDPSTRVGNSQGLPEDIADLFVWNTDTLANDGNMVMALTFGGPVATTDFAGDRDVIYGLHIDSDADNEADVNVWIRFAQNGEGEWGFRIENLPGTSGPVVGRVGAVTDLGGAKIFAGVRDDPFFFDLEGFGATVATGTLAFQNDRDFFAGLNVSTVIVEVPIRALPGDGPFNFWATTGRIQ